MKTRIVRTSIHDLSQFYEMNVFARYLFLHLATCDDLGHSNIFYYPDRKVKFYTRFNDEELELAKNALSIASLAEFYLEYVYVNPDYAVSTAGPKNEKARIKELAAIPADVKDFFIKKVGYSMDTVSIQYEYSIDTTINHKSEIINNKSENINHKSENINHKSENINHKSNNSLGRNYNNGNFDLIPKSDAAK